MFQPPVFREDRVDIMHNLMAERPFATLVTMTGGDINADHVPFVLYKEEGERGVLRGHISAGNPLAKDAETSMRVLVIFQGPQTYISPSLYASKQEHGKVVPTWNYAVVHARGGLRFTRDPQWLRRQIDDLTEQLENNRPDPWAVSDAPESFVSRQIRGLVGLEIQIDDLQGKWKTSQNKDLKDKMSIVDGLSDSGSEEAVEMADLVKLHITT